MSWLDELVRETVPGVGPGPVRQVRSRQATSAPIYEVEADLADGGLVRLLLKDLSRAALIAPARGVRPHFLHDPAREIGVYRDVLPLAPPGPPICVAAVDDAEHRWLLLEHVPGRELYEYRDLEPWGKAAGWFANLHTALAGSAESLAEAVPLLRHSERFVTRWLHRALSHVGERRLRPVVAVFPAVLDRLLALPRTVVHGEAYASNVLVDGDRVCAVDWETAAIGPGLVDLAALTAGSGWTDVQRLALCEAYRGGPVDQEFLADLDACRLQLALQWLGWAQGWRPPDEHAQDWLGEALALADRLSGG